MARGAKQKLKLPLLERALLRETAEDHPMTVQQLISTLEAHEVGAERKSIYDDMDALRELGLDVQSRKGKSPGWFIGGRLFELAELKLLVDAVQSSRFLTQKKSSALIGKLESLASVHQARQLQRQVYVDRRIKTMNESIFYNVDRLHGAIGANRVISFHYFEMNMNKERVFRRGGAEYQVTPYGLIWDNENYYLAGWDHDREEVRHYRVDKMTDITLTDQRGRDRGSWDLEGYTRRHFGMYAGRPCQLRLRCAAPLAGVFLDRFGQDIMLVPQDEEHFTVTLDLVVSPPFWGWLFGLGAQVEVLSPAWAVEEFRQRLDQVRAVYDTAKTQEA